MKNKKTYYQIILDKSGSMRSCGQSTIEGFNSQIETIKSLQIELPDQEIFVSITTFNDQVELIADKSNAENIPPLSAEIYRPKGRTALLDAIGISVNRLQLEIGKEIQNNEATAVIVIITDGHENASRMYAHPQIAQLIKELEETEMWTFTFLSATWDAVNVAQAMNMKRSSSRRYQKANLNQAWDDSSRQLNSYIRSKSKGNYRKDLMNEEEDKKKDDA